MPKSSPKTNKHPSAITVLNLTVRFADHIALEDVSFDVPVGNIAAVIGPNGSGKTTLIKTILGLIKPEHGDIKIFGSELEDARGLIGYVPQKFDFDKTFPITVAEFLHLHRHRHVATKKVEEKIKEVGLTPLILTKQLGSLSGGQLQRVLIASAIINSPTLLVLDEPATGVDIVGEAAFFDVIEHLNHEHNTTVIMVSHDISMVSRLVDQVICVNKNLLCSGPPQSVLTQKKLTNLYGGQSDLYRHSTHRHPSV